MRGTVPGLPTPYPIVERLPALYQEDEFTRRFVDGLDDVLAPVFAVLDSQDSYYDPMLAPVDFVDWLAEWVGLPFDEGWTLEQRRALVARGVALHRSRGTVRGLAEYVGLVTGGSVEIVESGGCTWSGTSGGALPGSDTPRLVVRVQVDNPSTVDLERLETLVGEVKPAHVPHRVEIVAAEGQ